MAQFPPPDIAKAFSNPTSPATFMGYKCVETSDDWRWACAPLPSNEGIAWTGYATASYPALINGKHVIVQPWLGHCQKFMGQKTWPGGIGAEVGVYVVKPRGQSLGDTSMLSMPRLVLEGIHLFGGDKLWWPDADNVFDISFTVKNPKTGKILLAKTSNGPTYWCNLWMQPDEYDRYSKDNGNTEPYVSRYHMEFIVGGQKFVWDGSGPLG